MKKLSIDTPWEELLDAACDGGLVAHITISGTGHGSLAFEIWLNGATPRGLEAANLATALFDMNGEATREMFDHCFCMGGVYREHRDHEVINFRGPVAGSLKDIIAMAETLQ